MAKQLDIYNRGTTTPVATGKFGKVNPGATSATLQYDIKNVGTDAMDMVMSITKSGGAVLAEGVTVAITHKRAATTIGTYAVAWNSMSGNSVMTPSPITDFQVNDILQVDLVWSPAAGVPVSPTNLNGFLKLTEV